LRQIGVCNYCLNLLPSFGLIRTICLNVLNLTYILCKSLGRRKRPAEALWADEEFKDLKKKRALGALEEQQVRIQLMKNQAELFASQNILVKEQTVLVRLQAKEVEQRYFYFSLFVTSNSQLEFKIGFSFWTGDH
jgi:hypothetical protein